MKTLHPKATKTTKRQRPRALDEATSARVLAEYLTIGKVATKEIDAILDEPTKAAKKRGLSFRQIALTFRISDVAGVPDAFAMHPRFRAVFADVRAVMAPAVTAPASQAVAS